MSEIYTPSFARRIVSRSVASVGLRYYDVLYCERDLTAAIPSPKPKIPASIRVADGNDVEAMMALRCGEERLVVQRIAERAVGYAAETDAGVVGYAWARAGAMHIFCRRPLQYFELVELPDRVCYTNNSYVAPAFRGLGLFQAMLAFQYRDRAAQGFTTVTNLIESVNLDSLAAHRRLGHWTQRARIVKLPGRAPRVDFRGDGPAWRSLVSSESR